MGKRGGYAGGIPGNMANIMKQAQKMQQKMEETNKSVDEMECSASSGGGAVTAVVNGKREFVSIKISPDAVDPDDVETLEDLVLAAVNEAMKKMEETRSEEMAKVTGGFGGFSGGGFPF